MEGVVSDESTMEGKCPDCGQRYLNPRSWEKNRILYAGESFWCYGCGGDRVAVPVCPDKQTPTMDENPWMKAERLEKELFDTKQVARECRRLEKERLELIAERDAANSKLDVMCQRCYHAEFALRAANDERDRLKKSSETLHDHFVAIENQLTESRRNFAIVAKLLREPK